MGFVKISAQHPHQRPQNLYEGWWVGQEGPGTGAAKAPSTAKGSPTWRIQSPGCPSKGTSCFHRPGEGAEILYLCQALDNAHAAWGGGVVGGGSQGGVTAQHLYGHLLESNVNSTKSMIFHYRPVSFKTET